MLQAFEQIWQRVAESPMVLRFWTGWTGLQPADDGIRYFSLKDPNPEPGLAWFVLNAFLLVAVIVMVTIALGIVFGSFRYWLLQHFPHNRFNGEPEDDPVVTFRLTDGAAAAPEELAPEKPPQ